MQLRQRRGHARRLPALHAWVHHLCWRGQVLHSLCTASHACRPQLDGVSDVPVPGLYHLGDHTQAAPAPGS